MKDYLTPRLDRHNSNSRSSILLVLSLTAIILFIRKTDALVNPQFWAEDGRLFFMEQYYNGASALFQDYAGYLHLIPRLIALIADSFFPYSLTPAVYSYSSFLITIIVVLSIFSPRFQINDKPLVALTITLIPHYTNEVFVNLANLQWILSIMLILVLLKENPAPKYGNVIAQYLGDLTIIILCGLTGPFIILLIPFFGWRCFKERKLYNSLIFINVVIISLVQLSSIASLPSHSQPIDFNLEAYSKIIGYRIIGNLFLEPKIPYGISHYALSFLYISIVVLAIHHAYYKKDRFTALAIGVSMVFFLATLYLFKSKPEVLIDPGIGQRYFYVPFVMLTWTIIALLKKQTKWRNILLTLILISSLIGDFRSKPLIDYNWSFYSKSIGKKDVVIPINPQGWQMQIEAHPVIKR